MMTDGDLAAERLDEIAKASNTDTGVTRLPWTARHTEAITLIRAWMEDAGLAVELDAAGTLSGRSPGAADRPRLLLGSHQDSVRHGGRFDGIMGIALACLAARRFRDRWPEMTIGVEVLAFADEEGVRFPTALIGPRALAGTLDPAVFGLCDADGESMGDAMRGFGLDPDRATELTRDPEGIIGFLEAHIEQGPVLEQLDQPVGIVTGICGISRHAISLRGETGHAGTVPMPGRRDALVGAARLIDRVNAMALQTAGLRATVGQLSVSPNVVNAIPEVVAMTLEVRSTSDGDRASFADAMGEVAAAIAADLSLSLDFALTYDQPPVLCDDGLQAALAEGAKAASAMAPALPSGATHDASAMADLCPVAMLFVRCRGGISHRPDEFASAADMDVAIATLAETIAVLDASAGEAGR